MFPNLMVDIDQELERYKKYAVKIAPLVSDTVHFLSSQLKANKRVLVEGANAAMLDIDFGSCFTSIYLLVIVFRNDFL